MMVNTRKYEKIEQEIIGNTRTYEEIEQEIIVNTNKYQQMRGNRTKNAGIY